MTVDNDAAQFVAHGRLARFEAMISTAWVMTVSTIQLFVIVVLASTLTDELGLSRLQLGALGAINTGVGAVLATGLGRVADRLGARRSLVAVVIASSVGLAATAIADSYPMLVVASALAGIPQGSSNSVTNKVIVEEVPPAFHGLVTGVKQSGVQFAAFLSGATLPASAALVGWRPALGAFAGFVLLTGLGVAGWHRRSDGRPALSPPALSRPALSPPSGPSSTAGQETERQGDSATTGNLDRFVFQVAAYALLLGMTAGGITRFYPLFSQEVLGFTEPEAGIAVSVGGLTAIVARLGWGAATDRLLSSRASLQVMAVGAACTAGMLLLAESVGGWALWPAVVVSAFSVVAWNVVAMLAVMRSVDAAHAGRATGIVLMGFLGGLTLSAPTVGYAVDRLGSYRPVWLALGALALCGAVVVRSPRPSVGSDELVSGE